MLIDAAGDTEPDAVASSDNADADANIDADADANAVIPSTAP